MDTFTIRKGDSYPTLILDLFNGSTPANISGNTLVELKFRPISGGAVTTLPMQVVSTNPATVKFEWSPLLTGISNVFLAFVVVTYPTGSESFPHEDDGYFKIEILPTL